jgi:hypothetical protein
MSVRRASVIRGVISVALLVGVASAGAAQRGDRGDRSGRGEGRGRSVEPAPNVPYDGRFTFARIRYEMSLDGFGGGRFGRDLPWSHDYPRAERNFTAILSELTTIQVQRAGSVILTLDDPELFKYPVAYMAEPGFWQPNDAEVAGMRAYLLKGGFFIFDDFAGQHFLNLEMQLRRVLPEHRLVRLTAEHPIFDSFYRIPNLDYTHPYYGLASEFWGVFEDNDPAKRLLMIINQNNDLSEYWEYSDQGMFPIDLSNEAYKLGINYIVYALTR